jgi:hypothetical protein
LSFKGIKKRIFWVCDLLLLAWPIVAPVATWVLGAGFYLALFIFFVIPSVYLSFKKSSSIKKALLFSVILLPVAGIFDYVMESTGGWHTFSIADSWRIFGHVSLENIIWAFWFVYFLVMFYEVFIDHHVRDRVYDKKIRFLFLIVFLSSTLFLLALFFNPEVLDIGQSYLKMGILILVTPLLFIPIRARKSFHKLIKAGFYFSVLYLGYELVALSLGHWIFPAEPDQYLGIIKFGEGIILPYEEVIFWVLLSAVSILAVFEFFDDDCK